MKRVTWLPALMLPLIIFFGCADGGPVGSGISNASAISGNVVAVNAEDGSDAAPGVEVRVSIDEFPDVTTTTDVEGNFELSGNFAGTVTVRFTVDELSSAQQFDVPKEANLVLQDVVISRRGVSVDTVRLLGFFGRVAFVDCSDGVVLVNDRKQAVNQFMVHLSSGTVLTSGDGVPLQCVDISLGDLVAVEGVIRFAQRVIEAVTFIVDPPRPGMKPPEITLGFHGRALVINCPGAMLLLDDPAIGRTRLRLGPDTVIFDDMQRQIRCEDIDAGDYVEGRGQINTRRPAVVNAGVLVVKPSAS